VALPSCISEIKEYTDEGMGDYGPELTREIWRLVGEMESLRKKLANASLFHFVGNCPATN
jgi:hypothetical protein